MTTDQIKIEIDHELCYGAQNCSLVAPGAFEHDEEGKSIVGDPSQATPEQILEAEAQCPAMAIRVSGLSASGGS
jgi:ferredoxin